MAGNSNLHDSARNKQDEFYTQLSLIESELKHYKGYLGSVEFSQADALFYGKVMGVRALISYEGENARELLEDFHSAVDDYLALCEAQGVAPEKAYKGSFNVRISPELHKQAIIAATANQMSLNSFVERSIKRAVDARN